MILFNHGVVVQPRCFLSAGIGLRQNLLIPVSVCVGDQARKFSLRQALASVRAVSGDSLVLDATEFDLWRRCAPWDRVRWSRE